MTRPQRRGVAFFANALTIRRTIEQGRGLHSETAALRGSGPP